MDAQAGLPLCCLQTPEDRFSLVEAKMVPSLKRESVMSDHTHLKYLQMIALALLFDYNQSLTTASESTLWHSG